MLKKIKKYTRIYFQLVNCAFSSYLSNRIDAIGFFLGKLARFIFFLVMLISIFRFTDNVAGYGINEVILFFLSFNLIDVGAQFLFRGVYFVKADVIDGHFDYILSKPVNKLFYTMSSLVDMLDLNFLVPIVGGIIYVFLKGGNKFTIHGVGLYLLLILNGMALVFVVHVALAALTVRYYESENLIWLYRESMTLGRMPPEIYSGSIQFIFTFLMPIFIMVAFPVKALVGMLSLKLVIFSILLTFMGIIFSLWLWKNSLNYYSSASS